MSNSYFTICKVSSNNFNFNYSDVLTIQINVCFSKPCFSPLTGTKIDYISKQLFIDVNGLNKATYKSTLSKVVKDALLCEITF